MMMMMTGSLWWTQAAADDMAPLCTTPATAEEGFLTLFSSFVLHQLLQHRSHTEVSTKIFLSSFNCEIFFRSQFEAAVEIFWKHSSISKLFNNKTTTRTMTHLRLLLGSMIVLVSLAMLAEASPGHYIHEYYKNQDDREVRKYFLSQSKSKVQVKMQSLNRTWSDSILLRHPPSQHPKSSI